MADGSGLLPIPTDDLAASGVLGPPAAAPMAAALATPGILSQLGRAGAGLLGSLVAAPLNLVNSYASGYANQADAAQTAMAQRHIAMQLMQQKMQALSTLRQSLPSSEQAVFDADPIGYEATLVKSREPQKMAGGESTQFGGPNGPLTTAPLLGIDATSGKPYSVTTAGATTGPSLGGDFKAGDGVIVSGRTGDVSGTYSQPQKLAPGETPGGFTPTVNGSGAPAPSPAPTSAAPGGDQALIAPSSGVAPSANAPRGIRNNNWGNLTALPNGQIWNGQTGVDKGGYATFATPQDGLKAAITNLHAYGARHGLNTVAQIAARWAPQAAGNNTAAYAKTVAASLGVTPDTKLDMTNPQMLNGLVHGISIAENGQAAVKAALGAGRPQAAPTVATAPGQPVAAAPAPAPAAPPSAPGWSLGQPNGSVKPVAPAEAISLGLAPGSYQRDPTGKVVQISAAPKPDMDRIASLTATTQTLRELVQEQQAFLSHNKNSPTGLQYVDPEVHGIQLNPLLAYQERNNNDVKNMTASEANQLFKVKPANAGARILQSELPFWERQTQSVSNSLPVNEGILNDNSGKLAKAQAQSDFYQNYVYQRGNLNGADSLWSKVSGHQPIGPDEAALLPSGTPFKTTDGRTLVRH